MNVANTNFVPERDPRHRLRPADRHEVPAGRPAAGGAAARHDPGPAAALHAARPDAVPADHQRRLGGRAAGHLRHRARPELRDQPLLLRLLHRGDARTATGSRASPPTPTLTGTVAGSELVLYQDPENANAEHHGGAITFGNDGKIYFTTGEHFNAAEAQSLTNPRGKIHRINPDGTDPDRQPVLRRQRPERRTRSGRTACATPTARTTTRRRAGCSSATSAATTTPPRRRRWTSARGARTTGGRTARARARRRAPARSTRMRTTAATSAITGGFVYHGTQFPASYQGSYFFADYTQNWIKRLTVDANGNLTGVFNFEPPDGSVDGPYGDIVYLLEGPDGALYYIDLGYSDISGTFGVSKIRRIRYESVEPATRRRGDGHAAVRPGAAHRQLLERGFVRSRGPTAHLLVDVRRQRPPRPSANPTHTYTQAGRLHGPADGLGRRELHDRRRRSPSASAAPPTATITSPTDGIFFRAGDVISFSGTGTDPDDGTLPAERLHLEHRLPARRPRPSGHPDHRRQERHVHDPDDRPRLQRPHALPDHAHGDRLERADRHEVRDHLADEGEPHLQHRARRA